VQVSREVQAIFQEYDSDFASMSLDEAFLDITNHLERRLSTSEVFAFGSFGTFATSQVYENIRAKDCRHRALIPVYLSVPWRLHLLQIVGGLHVRVKVATFFFCLSLR